MPTSQCPSSTGAPGEEHPGPPLRSRRARHSGASLQLPQTRRHVDMPGPPNMHHPAPASVQPPLVWSTSALEQRSLMVGKSGVSYGHTHHRPWYHEPSPAAGARERNELAISQAPAAESPGIEEGPRGSFVSLSSAAPLVLCRGIGASSAKGESAPCCPPKPVPAACALARGRDATPSADRAVAESGPGGGGKV